MNPIQMRERGNSLLRTLDKYAGIPLSLCTAAWRGWERGGIKPQSAGVAKNGIICLGAIGDLLLASALVNGLKEKLPDAQVEIICSNANAAALPLIPGVDAAAAFPVTAIPAMVSHVRRRQYGILFDTSQWSRLGSFICNLSRAAKTVGFSTKGQYRATGYDTKVSHRNDVHELENFLALGRAVWPDFNGIPSLSARAPRAKGQSASRIIYCHMWPAPGRGMEFKQWPESSWAALALNLAQRGLEVCFTGSQREAAATESFVRRYFGGNDKIRSIAGKTSLTELAALLTCAKAAVCVNTGIMHLAALLNVPTVGLHGATNPMRWGPVGGNVAALLPHEGHNAYLDLGFEYPRNATPNMGSLPVEDVLGALCRLGAL